MGRKRQSRKDLPERVYQNHGAYYFVGIDKKWIPLGKTLPEALKAYGEIIEPSKLHTMGQVFDRYLAEIVAGEKENTAEYKRRSVMRLKPVFGEVAPNAIKPRDIYTYIDQRQQKTSRNEKSKDGKSEANLERSVLSDVFKYAIRWGVVDRNPVTETKPFSLPKRDRYITDAEFKMLYESASPQIKCIMDIAYSTSLRKGDILKIKLGDIQNNELSVTTQKTGKKQVFLIQYDLAEVIAKAKALPRPILSTFLFCNRRGRQLSTDNFNKQWDKLKKKVGLHDQNLHFHDIRAKSATDARADGQDAQKLLGHANSSQTDAYIKAREIDRVTPLKRVNSKVAKTF